MRHGRLAGALLALTLVLGGLLAVPATASTVTGAALSGQVVSAADGSPVAGVHVDLRPVADGALVPADIDKGVDTDADGNWSIDRIYAGDYTLDFTGTGDLGGIWWGDQPSVATAAEFHLDAGQVATGLRTRLRPAARITGRVTTPDGVGVPQEHVSYYSNSSQLSTSGSVETDDDGYYSISAYRADVYWLRFEAEPGFPARSFGPTGLQTDGQQIIPGRTYVDDEQLRPAGALDGVVTSAATGLPVAGVYILLQNGDGYVTSASSDDHGRWSATGLLATEVSVTYWGTADTVPAVSEVAVGEGTTAHLRQAVASAGHLAGRITDSDGRPMAGVWVSASGPLVQFTPDHFMATDADGRYDIGGLTPGSYVVTANVNDPLWVYPFRYWPGVGTRDEATAIHVAAGQHRDGVDMTMHVGATVSGHVTGPDGPLAGAAVGVYDESRADHAYIGGAETGPDGSYSISDIPADGAYVVVAAAPNGSGLARAYSGGATWSSRAPHLALSWARTRTGVDIALHPGGRIAGHVHTADGRPADRPLQITLVSPTDDSPDGAQVGLGEDGSYALDGLRAGRYRLDASCSDGPALSPIIVDVAAHGTTTSDIVLAAGQDDTCYPQIVPAGTPVIAGRAHVGRTLHVRPWHLHTGQTLVTYTWYAGSHRLTNLGTSLRLTRALRGKRIKVHAVVTRTGYRPLRISSKPTAVVR